MKSVLAVALIVLALTCPMGFAATYSANGAGATGSWSTIGGLGADYASLEAAAADFNSIPAGLAGNYTFYLRGSLSSVGPICWGAPTNGFTLTFRPATAETVVVTLTKTVDNAGFSGSWLVGVPTASLAFGAAQDAVIVDMPNVIIDGDAPGGPPNSRDMTFQNTAAETGFPRVINCIGEVNNLIIRNMIVRQVSTVTTNAQSAWGVIVTGRRTAEGTPRNLYPDNVLIRNCDIDSGTGGQAQGLGLLTSNASALPAGINMSNCIVEDNLIEGNTRAFLSTAAATDLIVRRNRLRVDQTSANAGFTSCPLVHAGSGTATTGWTVLFENNVCDQIRTANNIVGAAGLSGCQLSGGQASPNRGNYIVRNNVFTGYDFTTASTELDMVYRGVESASSSVNVSLEHNSIYMPDDVAVSGATRGRAAGVVMTSTATTNTLELANNLIVFGQHGTNARVIDRASNLAFPVDASYGNNLVDLNLTNAFATIGTTTPITYTDFAAWQTAGYDTTATRGQSVNPLTTAPGVWNTANLHFTGGLPLPMKGTVPLAGVTTDIDGDSRAFLYTYPGADEQASFSLPAELSVFTSN